MHNCVLYKRGMEEGQSLERRFMCCEDVVDTCLQTVVIWALVSVSPHFFGINIPALVGCFQDRRQIVTKRSDEGNVSKTAPSPLLRPKFIFVPPMNFIFFIVDTHHVATLYSSA